MKATRKVIVYIAMSTDGYIAKPNDNLDFLSIVQQEGEDYGYTEFMSKVDTVVMGRRTYDWVMKHMGKFPHSELESFIVTRTARPSIEKTTFYTGNIKELIVKLKNSQGKSIFIDGGAEIVNEIFKEKLIDELVISIIPVLLGDGIRLFKDGRPEQNMKLLDLKQYPSGLAQLSYEIQTK